MTRSLLLITALLLNGLSAVVAWAQAPQATPTVSDDSGIWFPMPDFPDGC